MEEISTSEDKSYQILNEDYAEFDLSFKVIVIGNSGVGKTCLTTKATKDIFSDKHQSTIGFEFFSFIIKLENKIIKIQIWDTCGQEIYRSLISNFYKTSSLAFILYSITDRNSFDDIEKWVKELKINCSPDIKIFLIGNKSDLENERIISKLEGENLCKKFGFEYFIETSAKTGFNAKEIFIKCAMVLYKDFLNYYKSGRNFSMSSKSTYLYSKNKSATNDTSILKKNSNGKKRGKKSNNCC
jgi:small GTP-binding protein